MRAFALTLVFASAAVLAQRPVQPSAPDTVYIHGNILTGAHLVPAKEHPDASSTPARITALAVSHGSITAVGSDADILKLKSTQTKVIDLHGAFAMPGFNDAHTHMASAGRQKLTVDLDGTTSLGDMLSRIRAYVATAPAGSWILGSGWDHTKWVSGALPTRTDLDSVTGAHPAMFTRTDGHIVVANSAALKAANITAATPSPQGGKIDHDANGALTGIVREGPAIALLSAHIPPPSPDERRRALEIVVADALSHGVTSVQDFSEWDDFLVLESLERGHTLHLRVSEWLDFNLPLKTLEERRASHDPADPLLHIGQLKAYMDGSLGSRTAALAAPYSDEPTNSGITRYDQATLNRMSSERAAAGFQLGFHAIGDQANHMALDAFSAAEQVDSSKDPRFRIEHAQVLLPADFDRFAQLHVIASMQPVHLLSDMNWAAARLGPDRARYSYAWRSMLNHHITLAFGTDYPVESINPFRGLYAAITRQNEAGTASYEPQERLTRAEAIYAYTQASACAEFRERIKGRLEPGFLADIVVLDRDPFKSNPQELLHTRVLRTIVNGETVYQAP